MPNMRIAIFSHDLTKANAHLMPWRTVLEVAAGMNRAGHEAVIFSGRYRTSGKSWVYNKVEIKEIEKPRSNSALDDFVKVIRRNKTDVLFWPVAWWKARRNAALAVKINISVVWYVPGSCYSLTHVLKAVPFLGVRPALPYLAQALYPKGHLVRKLRNSDNTFTVSMSEFTRMAVIRAGFPSENAYAILPGKSLLTLSSGERPVFESVKAKLNGYPFFLFLGPPQAIRGIYQLISAFRKVVSKHQQARLVCLLRSDLGVNSELFRQRIHKMGLGDRLVCVWNSVSIRDLAAFLNTCYAVVLPFLLVPSEIPLAVIEAAGYKKPVITTGPGGTGQFAKKFGLVVPPAHPKVLAEAMLRLLMDERLYAQKCDAAERIFAAHPTWEQVSNSWLSIAKKAIEGNAKI